MNSFMNAILLLFSLNILTTDTLTQHIWMHFGIYIKVPPYGIFTYGHISQIIPKIPNFEEHLYSFTCIRNLVDGTPEGIVSRGPLYPLYYQWVPVIITHKEILFNIVVDDQLRISGSHGEFFYLNFRVSPNSVGKYCSDMPAGYILSPFSIDHTCNTYKNNQLVSILHR